MRPGKQLTGLQVKADEVLPRETEATPERGAALPRHGASASLPPHGSLSGSENTAQTGLSPPRERVPSLSLLGLQGHPQS